MDAKERRDLEKFIHVNVMDGDKYVGLMKRGLWYRPDACGYTDRQSEAWRITREEAKKHEYPRDEPVTIREFDVRSYTTDPAAAMEVLKKCMTISDLHFDDSRDGTFHIVNKIEYADCIADAPTLELAICLFAKKLFSK